jgi:hypothetical protein
MKPAKRSMRGLKQGLPCIPELSRSSAFLRSPDGLEWSMLSGLILAREDDGEENGE